MAGERPPAARIHWLSIDEPWTEAPEPGALARIFNQDVFNLPKVQRGLRATQRPGVTLANYQEVKFRHFHALPEEWTAQSQIAASCARFSTVEGR